VIVLGGLGSVIGAVWAGILIGMIQALTTAYISSQLADAVLFGLLFLVLLIRPTGFFSRIHVEHRTA
jgi:branched-chain amino acid transport system permease protein